MSNSLPDSWHATELLYSSESNTLNWLYTFLYNRETNRVSSFGLIDFVLLSARTTQHDTRTHESGQYAVPDRCIYSSVPYIPDRQIGLRYEMYISAEGLRPEFRRKRHTLQHCTGLVHNDTVSPFRYTVVVWPMRFLLFSDNSFPSEVVVSFL